MAEKLILLTGGAGYIGGHTIQELLAASYKIVVLDNLSAGTERVIPENVILEKIDLLDKAALEAVFQKYKFEAVIHNAAKIDVIESMERPLFYYENNVQGTLNLLQAMLAADCKNLVFASTAAVYGNAEELPIREDAVTLPVNVYGKSKLMAEEMIRDAAALGLKSVIFRFFNVGGVDLSVGRAKAMAKNIMGVIVGVLAGERDSLDIYGSDLDTADGSPGRDYIHVKDIARAEAMAVDYLLAGGDSVLLNLSRGEMATVKELIILAEEFSGRKCNFNDVAARPGEVPVSFASADKAKELLQWQAEYALMDIISSEWDWYKQFNSIKN